MEVQRAVCTGRNNNQTTALFPHYLATLWPFHYNKQPLKENVLFFVQKWL